MSYHESSFKTLAVNPYMSQTENGAMHEERRGNGYSCDDMTDSGELCPCKRCGQILNNWNELMFHMKSQHTETCNKCSRIPGTNSCVGDQTT